MIGRSDASPDDDLSATLAPGATCATREAHIRLRTDDTALAAARARHDAADMAFDLALDERVSMTALRLADDELDHAATAQHDAENASRRSAELFLDTLRAVNGPGLS